MLQRIRKYPMIEGVIMLNSMGNMIFDDYIVDSLDLNPANFEWELETKATSCKPIVLLEGGADIHPTLYGETNRFSYPNIRRDTWEKALYMKARELNIPILGICRGHQLMAALNGGTLYQDIGRELHLYHRGGPLKLSGVFSEWYPEGFVANSLHHQAVKQVPGNAQVVALAEDNVNEALWYPNDNMFSVQFHPEMMDSLGAELLAHIVELFYPELAVEE